MSTSSASKCTHFTVYFLYGTLIMCTQVIYKSKALTRSTSFYMRVCRVLLQREVLAVPQSAGLGQPGTIHQKCEFLFLPLSHPAVLGTNTQATVGRRTARKLSTAEICLHLLYWSTSTTWIPCWLCPHGTQWIHQSHRYSFFSSISPVSVKVKLLISTELQYNVCLWLTPRAIPFKHLFNRSNLFATQAVQNE